MHITQSRAHELLRYEPETGLFFWKIKPSTKIRAGALAGHTRVKGKKYVAIVVENQLYLAHRLAWLYVHGRFPSNLIDHINGIRDDNRIANLREVTYQENSHNSGRQLRAQCPFRGLKKRGNSWQAAIRVNKKSIYLGSFKTAEEASDAYLAARAIYMPIQPIPRELLPGA